MELFVFPLRYLVLRDERGWPLILRDSLAVVVLAVVLTVPFWFPTANYFGEGGFLDRFGAFAGVLTGFYVAGLVAIASLAMEGSSLDETMQVGSVTQDGEKLSRRQYVSAMFGYLSFVSLMLSLVGLLAVVSADSIASAISERLGHETADNTGLVTIFLINLVLAHMVATTCHGLYYLIERMYAQKAVLLDKNGNPLDD